MRRALIAPGPEATAETTAETSAASAAAPPALSTSASAAPSAAGSSGSPAGRRPTAPAAAAEAHTQTLVALHDDPEAAVQAPSLAETAVQPSRVVGGLLPEHAPAPERDRHAMVAALTDPTWLTYLGVLVGAMVVTLILGILLVVS